MSWQESFDIVPDSGTYVLIVLVSAEGSFRVGEWGELEPADGYYAYVGRAKKGLVARLSRHVSSRKKRYWHVDYLLEHADLVEAWLFVLEAGECDVASRLVEAGGKRHGLERFGSSDCRCPGHLVYLGRSKPQPLSDVESVLEP